MRASDRESPELDIVIASREDTANEAAKDTANDLHELAERVRLRVDPDDMPPPLFLSRPCTADD